MDNDNFNSNSNYDIDDYWNNRILCEDGACIGIIGTDGACKECGKRYTGASPLPISDDFSAKADVKTELEKADPFLDQVGVISDLSSDDADFWENRVLCSDGSCIGVLGSDGICKECGKSG